MADEHERQDRRTERPDLPEPYGVLGLLVGFGLSAIYFGVVIQMVPNDLFPIHIVLSIPIVFIFTGVPALFERLYWRWEA